MDLSEKGAVSEMYKWAVQALALDAQDQVSLFPACSNVLDELDLDLQGAQSRFLAAWGDDLLEGQRQAVLALDGQLETMGGEANVGLWEAGALAGSPEWGVVRDLARELLKRFGWTLEKPPGQEQRAVYVTGPEGQGQGADGQGEQNG